MGIFSITTRIKHLFTYSKWMHFIKYFAKFLLDKIEMKKLVFSVHCILFSLVKTIDENIFTDENGKSWKYCLFLF